MRKFKKRTSLQLFGLQVRHCMLGLPRKDVTLDS